MFLTRVAGLVVAGVLAFNGFSGLALAKENKEAKLVKFENKQIDLSKGWDEAKACVIWDTADASQCFRTEAELAAYTDKINGEINAGKRGGEVGTLASCSSYLRLWEHSSYGGRLLQFADRGYWQNLSGYSFNDEVSSYAVGACSANLAEHSSGGGYYYPGNTNAGAYGSCMCAGSTSWNDRVSSIRVN